MDPTKLADTRAIPSALGTDPAYDALLRRLLRDLADLPIAASFGGGGGAPLPLTTKGDLLVHDGTADVRLPVGANNQVLTADSTQSAGLKWAAAGGGGASADAMVRRIAFS